MRWKEQFSMPVWQTNGPPCIDCAFLQEAVTVTMHCQPERCPYPPPPVPPFLLVQNLSSKWIAPTVNMLPKTDDAIVLWKSTHRYKLAKVGHGHPFKCSTFHQEKLSMHVYNSSVPSNSLKYWINNNVQQSYQPWKLKFWRYTTL